VANKLNILLNAGQIFRLALFKEFKT